MRQPDSSPTLTASEGLSAFYWSDETLRSRSVSTQVLMATLDVPTPPPKLVLDWEREIAEQLGLEPGDVESLPLARTRLRWPDLKRCVAAASHWSHSVGLADVLATSDMALMACRGARYHHDAVQYGGAAFCNLFLSEDRGLDLYFPALQLRIPLRQGTAVVFDTGQPHAVVPRDHATFNAADFPKERDCSLVFLTWELPLEHPPVARALGVVFDTDTRCAAALAEAQLWRHGAPAHICPATGGWV